jgi:hypothetical protein
VALHPHVPVGDHRGEQVGVEDVGEQDGTHGASDR